MVAMRQANGFERKGVPMPFERKALYKTVSTPQMPAAITANTSGGHKCVEQVTRRQSLCAKSSKTKKKHNLTVYIFRVFDDDA